jgi:hypothetical protein
MKAYNRAAALVVKPDDTTSEPAAPPADVALLAELVQELRALRRDLTPPA